MAAGAERASGEVIWFLHADTRLAFGTLAALEVAMTADPTSPGGNFRLLFDGDDGFSRWLNGFYAWLRRRGFYYGDSGIFIRRSVLAAVGGVFCLKISLSPSRATSTGSPSLTSPRSSASASGSSR